MSTNSLQGYNLDNFEANFREFLITERVSPLTLKNYLSDLRHFLGWFSLFCSSRPSNTALGHSNNESDIISRLDNTAAQAYKNYLETNRLPEKTINRRLSTLRKFCSLCISQGWLKENPAKGLSNVNVHRHHGVLPVVSVEVQVDQHDNPDNGFSFSAKQLFDFQKSLTDLPAVEAQAVAKDIEEFFIITNSTLTV